MSIAISTSARVATCPQRGESQKGVVVTINNTQVWMTRTLAERLADQITDQTAKLKQEGY